MAKPSALSQGDLTTKLNPTNWNILIDALNDLADKVWDVTIHEPSATQVINAAGDAILANATLVVLNPDADYTLTSTPTIANGTQGQILYITCANAEAHTVTVQDAATLPDSNLHLPVTTRGLTGQSVLKLLFDGTGWVEVGFAAAGGGFLMDQNVRTIDDVVFAGVTVGNAGLHILDTNASHDLIIAPGSDISADRTLTLTTGDSDRTITLSGNATLDDWFDQAVKAASSPTFAGVTLNNAGLHILDTNASHDLVIKPGSDLSSDRILTLTTGDAARTITLSGDPTLSDWFDQSVKTTATPALAGISIGTLVYTPSGTQVIDAAGDTISADAAMVILNPNADHTLTSTPTIANGSIGQRLSITCANAEAHTVTVQDEGTLGGSNLRLGATGRGITGKTVLELVFDGTEWVEVGFAAAGGGFLMDQNVRTVDTPTFAGLSVGTLVYTPSATQVINAAGDAILANAAMVILNPDADYTLTSTPTIANGTTGQMLTITCASGETQSITVQDQGTLGASNLQLQSAMRTITQHSRLVLGFNGTNWEEQSYVLEGSSGDINVRDFGAIGDGADDYDAINAAHIAATVNGASIVFPSGSNNTYRINTSITFNQDTTLVIAPGATLKPDSGVTITINGGLIADVAQIFDLSLGGTIAFTAGEIKEVYPEWWGAIGNNSTDCTAAFNAAITAAENIGKVRVLSGIYKITSPINEWPADSFAAMKSGIILEGNGTYSHLRYTGTTGYCLDVAPADQLSGGAPIGNTIQDIHMSAPNIAHPDDGGCIAIGSSSNFVNRVTFADVADATGIAIRPRDVDQSEASMTNDTNRDLTTTGAGASEKYAFKFTSQSRATSLSHITVRMGKTGAPAGTCHWELWSDDGGAPSKPNAQIGGDSNTVTNTDLNAAADGADQKFTWYHKAKPGVSASTVYWLVCVTDGYTYADGVTEVRLRVDAGDGSTDEFATFTWGGAWANSDDGVNHAITITFGQPIDIFISQCTMYGAGQVGRGIWLDQDGSIATITDCLIYGKECLRTFEGFAFVSGCYLYNADAGYPIIYADDSWVSIQRCWIEGPGGAHFGGSRAHWYSLNTSLIYTPITWDSGVQLTHQGNTGDSFLSDDATVIPDSYKYKIMPAVSGLWKGGTLTADPDALNGNSMELVDTQWEYTRVENRWSYDASYLAYPMRGTYKVTIFMKDTDQVANDCQFNSTYYNGTWQVDWNTSFTLTAEYKAYTFLLVVDSHEVFEHTHTTIGKMFQIMKITAADNTISVSHAIMEYVGPDIPAQGDLVAYNTDPSDVDGARSSSVLFYGRRSGNESEPMAEIKVHHDGAADDIKGELDIMINDGTDKIGALSSSLRIAADGGVFIPRLKTGTTQGAAGAAAGEVYVDTDDQTLKVGI